MYLHIGQNEILPDRRVIGIFDLDKCSYGKRTREYLAAAEKEGVVLDVSPKTMGWRMITVRPSTACRATCS